MAKIDEQTLVEHLSEFRKRLIITIMFFIAAFLVSLLFCSDIYKLLTASFKQKLTVLGPNDILSIYLMLAGICAFSLTLPFTSYQIWAFIRPALKEKEAKAILSYVPATFILFVTGLSFGFFISSGLCILVGVIGLLRGVFSISLFYELKFQFFSHELEGFPALITGLILAVIFGLLGMVCWKGVVRTVKFLQKQQRNLKYSE